MGPDVALVAPARGRFSLVSRSIGDGRDLTDEMALLQFIDEGNRVIFGGNAAIALGVGQQRVRARAEFARALARRDDRGRREASPVEVGHAAVVVEYLPMRERCLGFPLPQP